MEIREGEVLLKFFFLKISLENVGFKLFKKFNNCISWSEEMVIFYLFEVGIIIYKENKCFGIWIFDKNNDNNWVEIFICEVERILIFGNI